MDQELIAQFAQIQRYAAGLQGLLNEAQAVAPTQSSGRDSSGAVQVELGQDGLPSSFTVARDWEKRREADQFGAAVLEACQSAIGDRMTVWTQSLDENDWQDRAERLKDEPEPPAKPSDNAGAIPPAFRRAVENAEPRPLQDLAEDVIGAFDKLETSDPKPPPLGTGTSGRLTITLSSTGLVSCTAEPRWAAGKSAAVMMNALSEAVAKAKANLAEQTGEDAEPGMNLDRLLAETFSLLNDPDRLAGN